MNGKMKLQTAGKKGFAAMNLKRSLKAKLAKLPALSPERAALEAELKELTENTWRSNTMKEKK